MEYGSKTMSQSKVVLFEEQTECFTNKSQVVLAFIRRLHKVSNVLLSITVSIKLLKFGWLVSNMHSKHINPSSVRIHIVVIVTGTTIKMTLDTASYHCLNLFRGKRVRFF